MKTYLLHALIAVSQLGNTLLGGHPDESMSARAWRTSKKGRWPGVLTRPLIDALFFVITFGRDAQHCRDSYDSEVSRRQFPDHYRS